MPDGEGIETYDELAPAGGIAGCRVARKGSERSLRQPNSSSLGRWRGESAKSLLPRAVATVSHDGSGGPYGSTSKSRTIPDNSRFSDAVERNHLPEAVKHLGQIRRVNLVLGLVTIIVGASGRFW